MTIRSLASRLSRLGDPASPFDDRGNCRTCGAHPSAIRTIEIARHDGNPASPLRQLVDEPDQPGRPRCPACDLYLGVALLDEIEVQAGGQP